MNINVNELFFDMSCFNDEMSTISKDDIDSILSLCLKLEKYLLDKKFICRQYDLYKEEWQQFERGNKQDIRNKTLFEMFVYLFIYSREEHMSGGYGSSYLRAFKNDTIPILLKEIVNRLEKMAMTQDDKSDRYGSLGISGEYFVMAELTRRGFVASLTSKNTKAIDLLVSDKSGSNLASIQVKTCDDIKQKKWKMSKSVENNYSQSSYYVLVNLNNGNEPSFYVVPSKYLAYRVNQDYEKWLNTPAKNNKPHNETEMRTFSFIDEHEEMQYKDAWYLLGI